MTHNQKVTEQAEQLYPTWDGFKRIDSNSPLQVAHIKALTDPSIYQSVGLQKVYEDAIEFDSAVSIERGSFCHHINSMKWDSVLRTYCESLLIMYDQMRERLLPSPPKTDNPS